jgi:hypothetical protein
MKAYTPSGQRVGACLECSSKVYAAPHRALAKWCAACRKQRQARQYREWVERNRERRRETNREAQRALRARRKEAAS